MLEKIRKVRTKHKRLALSPDRQRIAMWTEGTDRFSIYECTTKKVVSKTRLRHEIRHVSWSPHSKRLIITCAKYVMSYDLRKKRPRCLVATPNVSECYKAGMLLLTVQGQEIVIMQQGGAVHSTFTFDFFKIVGKVFVLALGAHITVLDENLKIVYDHIFDIDSRVTDVAIRNNKIYVLACSTITGHDLNLKVSASIIGFFVSDKFLFLVEKTRVVVYDKNLEVESLRVDADDCCLDMASNTIYVLARRRMYIYTENMAQKLTFTLIEECQFYYELEGEFDTSDDTHRDF